MSVHNGSRFLKESIGSILVQSYRDFEFLIVDDGSTDNSLEIAQRAAASDKRVRVISNRGNIGLTRSLNRAIREAAGEYVARHDADDVALPDRFREQVARLDGDPSCAVVGTNYLVIDAEGRAIPSGIASHYASDTTRALRHGLNPVCHSSVMFRKAVIQNAGSYDESYRYAQDYELWLRLVLRGYAVCNLPAKLQKLRRSGEEIAVTQRRAQLRCIIRIQARYFRYFWRNAGFLRSMVVEVLRLGLPFSLKRRVGRWGRQ